jgi:tetratricopeptide (TPR) repeat protein
MSKIDASLLEQYQQLLQKDPSSQVFAPLAEGYRERGMLKEAEKILRDGLKKHPSMVTGLVVFAKVLRDLGDFNGALQQLDAALSAAPENLLAYQLRAETYLQLKKPKEALKSFKMLLFLNPQHQKAQAAIKKLESLTADEYDEELFKMTKLTVATEASTVGKNPRELQPQFFSNANAPVVASKNADQVMDKAQKYLERALSLIDAFIVRNDLDKAKILLEDAKKEFGDHIELAKRLRSLQVRYLPFEEATPLAPLAAAGPEGEKDSVFMDSRIDLVRDKKIAVLKTVLRKIQQRADEKLTET